MFCMTAPGQYQVLRYYLSYILSTPPRNVIVIPFIVDAESHVSIHCCTFTRTFIDSYLTIYYRSSFIVCFIWTLFV